MSMPTPTRTTHKQQQQELSGPARMGSGQHPLTSPVPGPTSPHAALVYLQRTAGNQAVSQIIQAKLRENRSDKTSQQATEQGIMAQPLPPSGGRPLPEAVRQKMETAFGQDFSAVRIHERPHVASLGAIAYTQGTDIHFAPGTYRPESASGQALIGHELTHVVQQKAGQVPPVQRKGIGINVDPALESEAERLGTQAAQGDKVVVRGAQAGLQPSQSDAPIQMQPRSRLERLLPNPLQNLVIDFRLKRILRRNDIFQDQAPNQQRQTERSALALQRQLNPFLRNLERIKLQYPGGNYPPPALAYINNVLPQMKAMAVASGIDERIFADILKGALPLP